ncbi:MAG: energy-coupling factor transporter transmembrane protein EcfT [Deltaproteobacteria bacterium]|jgi:energy-coupling factor transport system permease protein|nr:energy-coupling factor transporter transmembrane protein EcfT [Deltaproteobacteria bacterium]
MRALSRIDRHRGAGRLHLRPETRLLLMMAASVSSLALGAPRALALLLAFSMLYAAAETRPRTLLMAYAFMGLMCAMSLACVWLLGSIFPPMRDAPLSMAISPFLRLGVSLNALLPLALNSRLTDLAMALGRLRLPGIVRLPLMVTIRFIPTILNDLVQLREVVGIRFRGRRGLLFWLRHPLTWWRVFFQPLIVRLIRSADELAMASELKGLEPDTDFGGHPGPFSADDRLTMLMAALAVGLSAAAEMALRGLGHA